MTGTVRTVLRKVPYGVGTVLLTAAGRFLLPEGWAFRLGLAAALLALSAVAYLRSRRFVEGRRGVRRRFEAAVAFLAAVETVGTAPWGFWLSLPLFLFFVYADLRVGALVLLLAWHMGYRLLWGNWSWPEAVLLLLSVSAALLFRSVERGKRAGISDRLKSYEREAGGMAARSEEQQAELRLEEKRNEHLTSMIQEREAGFRALLEILHRSLAPQTSALFLFDPIEGSFLLKEIRTSSDRVARRTLFPAAGILQAVLRGEEPVRLVSPNGDARGLVYYEGESLTRSVAAVPVQAEGVFQGVLVVDRREPRAFTDDEMETVARVAGEIARLIGTSETLHAFFRLKEELSSLYAASSALSRNLRMEDVLRTLLESARKIVPYDLGLVVLHDPVRNSNRVAAVQGAEGEELAGETFACAPERGLLSWVIQNRTPLSYDDFKGREGRTPLFHKRWPLANLFDSILALPMQVQGEPLGAVLFAAERNRSFPRNERKILEVVTNQAAVAIKNARMVATLEALATTDGLTGLTNHRTFQEALSRELERSGRHPSATSLLLIDIDHFKKFNDEYGHPVGDLVLKGVAQLLAAAVRKVDVVARYGGEEFAVILVGTSAAGARQMAERIVRTVAQGKFRSEGVDLRVTVSVGGATFPEDARSREELIEKADRALYAAKKGGRNRAVSYAPSMAGADTTQAENRRIEGVEDEARRRAPAISSSVT